MPRDVWTRFFASAEHEIGILVYSALFLAEDAGILRILADKGRVGVSVRIALGDADSPHVAERGAEEGIGEAMPAKVRNALTLYHPLREVPNIEIRLHRTTLYNSIYRADDQLLVNQHAYGVHASHAPVFCLTGRARRHGRYGQSETRLPADSGQLAMLWLSLPYGRISATYARCVLMRSASGRDPWLPPSPHHAT